MSKRTPTRAMISADGREYLFAIEAVERRTAKSSEIVVLLLCISTLIAVKDGAMSVRQSEQLLFSPRTIRQLRQAKTSRAVVEIIARGAEIENIVSMIPAAFNREIEKLILMATTQLRKRLKVLPPFIGLAIQKGSIKHGGIGSL